MVIVDYGMGNLGSILNIVKKAGTQARLSTCPEEILKAKKLILPGVGAFDTAISNLHRLNYVDALKQRVLIDKIPILGICLGMQLFTKRSEEGQKSGFGWLDAETIRLTFDTAEKTPKIPHMGWNTVSHRKSSHFFSNPENKERFYFVHSFHVLCNNADDILATTEYGIEFTSAVCHENILGVQFHPEKSHRYGMEFLKAFISWAPVMK